MKPSTAAAFMIVLLGGVLLYHLIVITGIIDYSNAWGGKLTSSQQMYLFEAVSIVINLFLLFVVLQKAGRIPLMFSMKIVNAILWIFVVIFSINSVANLFAERMAERIGGTVLTVACALLCWTMLRGDHPTGGKR